MDAIEMITDYESAADHTRSLDKWQQMSIPVTLEASRQKLSTDASGKSAFDAASDNTYLTERPRTTPLPGVSEKSKWKFKGPWLAGMSEGEFRDYVEKQLKSRRGEFMVFLRERIKERIIETRRYKLREEARLAAQDANVDAYDAGTNVLSDDPSTKAVTLPKLEDIVVPTDITEEEYADSIRVLRSEALTLTSPLTQHIASFLDLPPLTKPMQESLYRDTLAATLSQYIDASDSGPPTTHPSAGLSYLRTLQGSRMPNHPLFGPQKSHTPLQARILQAREHVFAQSPRAKLGLGGFVVEDPNARSNQPTGPGVDKAVEAAVGNTDYDFPGGRKVWVVPTRASVDQYGRVRARVARADAEAVGVKTGDLSIAERRMGAERNTALGSGMGRSAGSSGLAALGALGGRMGSGYKYGGERRNTFNPPSMKGFGAGKNYGPRQEGKMNDQSGERQDPYERAGPGAKESLQARTPRGYGGQDRAPSDALRDLADSVRRD